MNRRRSRRLRMGALVLGALVGLLLLEMWYGAQHYAMEPSRLTATDLRMLLGEAP